jgi:HD-GYP domain-containing protein (c-di-GMP phosphodiesterase class II)
MSTTIAVDELRVGMYVHLDLGWMQHPFPVGSFRITDARQIDKIRGLGLERLRWNPDKSLIVPPAFEPSPLAEGVPAAEEAAEQAAAETAVETAAQAAERERRARLAAQRESAALCQRQFDEAAQAWRDAQALVVADPEQARRRTEALSRALLDKMLVDGDMCIRLLSCNAGDAAGTHAMNVTVVALLLGRVFGLSDDEMLDLGTGALLHDVGKLALPETQRHADEGSTAEDLAAYRSHVAQGVLQGRRMGLAAGPLLVIAQHHESADGSGFPSRATSERLSMAARIVALVNRYDNLCNPARPGPAPTPHEALSRLFAQERSRFDATLLNSFIRMMGVYPAGSVVQLTDDRYALVTSVNSTRPLKPNVLIHDPATPRDEALIVNLMHAPDLGIRRSLKPAQLPPEAFDYLAPRHRVAYFFEAASLPADVDGDDDA